MKTGLFLGFLLISCGVPSPRNQLQNLSRTKFEHRGICDASASINLNQKLFIVANDEDNILRVYERTHAALPAYTFDLSNFYDNITSDDEMDLEAATEIEGVQYWLSSHGRNSDGKYNKMRYRFLATRIESSGAQVQFTKVGQAYENLVQDMLQSPELNHLNLDAFTQLSRKKVPHLAPKKSGLNIEGLSLSRDGHTMLIGLRNPIPNGAAILIPLLNPSAVVQGARAMFGQPYRFDLKSNDDTLGIRSMEYSQTLNKHLVVAGNRSSDPQFKLFLWDEGSGLDLEPLPLQVPANFNPEAANLLDDQIELLSDDGNVETSDGPCKKLPEEHPSKGFQRLQIDL